jgi:hypothetical protein
MIVEPEQSPKQFLEPSEVPRRAGRRDAGAPQLARQLARQLDLVSEYWTINSVLDRSAEPCHPPSYISHQDWFRCRDVRNELLAALRTRGRP